MRAERTSPWPVVILGLLLVGCAWWVYRPAPQAWVQGGGTWADGVDLFYHRFLRLVEEAWTKTSPPQAGDTVWVSWRRAAECRYDFAAPCAEDLVQFLQRQWRTGPRAGVRVVGVESGVRGVTLEGGSQAGAARWVRVTLRDLTLAGNRARLAAEVEVGMGSEPTEPGLGPPVGFEVELPLYGAAAFVRALPPWPAVAASGILVLAGLALAVGGWRSRYEGLNRYWGGACLLLAGAGGLFLAAYPPERVEARLRHAGRIDLFFDTSDAVVYPGAETEGSAGAEGSQADAGNTLTRFMRGCVERVVQAAEAGPGGRHRGWGRWLREEWRHLVVGDQGARVLAWGRLTSRLHADVPGLEKLQAGQAQPAEPQPMSALGEVLRCGHRQRPPGLILPWLAVPTEGTSGEEPTVAHRLAVLFSTGEAVTAAEARLYERLAAQRAASGGKEWQVITVGLPSVPRSGKPEEKFQFEEEKVRLLTLGADRFVALNDAAAVRAALAGSKRLGLTAALVPVFRCEEIGEASAARWQRATDLDERRRECFEAGPGGTNVDAAAAQVAEWVMEDLGRLASAEASVRVFRHEGWLLGLWAVSVVALVCLLALQEEVTWMEGGGGGGDRWLALRLVLLLAVSLGFALGFLYWRGERDGAHALGRPDLLVFAGIAVGLGGFWAPLAMGRYAGRLRAPQQDLAMWPRQVPLGFGILAMIGVALVSAAAAWLPEEIRQTQAWWVGSAGAAAGLLVLGAGAFAATRFWRERHRRWVTASSLLGVVLVASAGGIPVEAGARLAVSATGLGLLGLGLGVGASRSGNENGRSTVGGKTDPTLVLRALVVLTLAGVALGSLVYGPVTRLPGEQGYPIWWTPGSSWHLALAGWVLPLCLLFLSRWKAIMRETTTWKAIFD